MTVDDVAEAAGVGKATIYRRWASKEQLANDYRDLLQRRIALTRDALDRARARGERIRSTVDPVLMVQWLAGVFVIRALTGEPMPTPEEADHLVEVTLRSIMER